MRDRISTTPAASPARATRGRKPVAADVPPAKPPTKPARKTKAKAEPTKPVNAPAPTTKAKGKAKAKVTPALASPAPKGVKKDKGKSRARAVEPTPGPDADGDAEANGDADASMSKKHRLIQEANGDDAEGEGEDADEPGGLFTGRKGLEEWHNRRTRDDPPPVVETSTPAFSYSDEDFKKLQRTVEEQTKTLSELRSELNRAKETLSTVTELEPKLKEQAHQIAEILRNPIVEDIKQIREDQSYLRSRIQALSGRLDQLDQLKLADVLDVLQHKLNKSSKELSEHRQAFDLVDKTVEVLYAKVKVLESRPPTGRIVAFGTPNIPAPLTSTSTSSSVSSQQKRKRDGEDDGPPATRVYLKPGLGPNTRQWVEEGPNGFTVTTHTGVVPLAAAWRRDTGI